MIETFSGLPRKSLTIFGKFWEMFGKFVWLSEQFWKSSERGRKSSENCQKRRHQYVYIIKRTLHLSSKIRILCSRCKHEYLARSLRSLLRYCSCHLNIKFISSRHRGISSIYHSMRFFLPFHSPRVHHVTYRKIS